MPVESYNTIQQDSKSGQIISWQSVWFVPPRNSRMELRVCKLTYRKPDGTEVTGTALNERCFGVLG